MRLGVDTNILLRALLNDDPRQSEMAHGFLASLGENRRGYVGISAVLETFWVLRSRYRVSRQSLYGMMRQLLMIKYLEIETSAAVAQALSAYQKRQADFEDALLAARNAEAGCAVTYTFDRDAAKAVGSMKILEDIS